jgi:hypothetical protein
MAKRIAGLALATGLVAGVIVSGIFGIPGMSDAQSTWPSSTPATSPIWTQAATGSASNPLDRPAREANDGPDGETTEAPPSGRLAGVEPEELERLLGHDQLG